MSLATGSGDPTSVPMIMQATIPVLDLTKVMPIMIPTMKAFFSYQVV